MPKPSLIAQLIATFFFVGKIKKIPGTCGSLAGLFTMILAIHLNVPSNIYHFIFVITLILAVLASRHYVKVLKHSDPQEIVIDEVLGLWITFWGIQSTGYFVWILGFLLFRLFDITKPLFIKKLEHIREGVGVIADDLLAGIYANLVLRLISHWVVL